MITLYKVLWGLLVLSILYIILFIRGYLNFPETQNYFGASLLLCFIISNIFFYIFLKKEILKNALTQNLKIIAILILVSTLIGVYLIFFYNFLMIYVILIYGCIILIFSSFSFFRFSDS